MDCSECKKTAVARVTTNGETSYVCTDHRVALAKRIEQMVTRFGHVPNLREIAMMACDNIVIEDLP